jgi:hypothetical protein
MRSRAFEHRLRRGKAEHHGQAVADKSYLLARVEGHRA